MHGRFAGKGLEAEARKALVYARRLTSPPKAVLLSRDTDGDLSRRQAYRAAREQAAGEQVVALAVAHPMREAWLLAGFLKLL